MAIQKNISAVKVQWLSMGAALIGSPIFAKLVDIITGNQLSCGTIGDIGGCGNYDIFYYFFGFYFGALFLLSVAHFGLLSWKRIDYIVIILLFLAVGLLDSELMKLALGFLAAGIIVGLIVAQVRKMRAKSSG